MKNICLIFALAFISLSGYSQYRWEVSGGLTSSKLNLDDIDSERGSGFFFNAGYGYMLDNRAKTSMVFSLDLLQRNSEIGFRSNQFEPNDPIFENNSKVKFLQVGLTPKFRYFTGSNKDAFRAFVGVGPSFRVNANVEVAGEKLETDQFEQLVIGGVYHAGFSYAVGEMFDIMAEAGAMNDFIDNLKEMDGKSKFFDIYLRIGLRFRIYDARR